MKIICKASDHDLAASVVSIGMFDGVHRGHRKVLELLRSSGQRQGLPTVLVTFDPHPRALLRPECPPALLSSLADRMELLASTGAVDYCLVLNFDRRQSQESADDFVDGTLVQGLHVRSLILGENFSCGRQRQGNIPYLQELGTRHGFDVQPVALRSPSEVADVTHCSSSETRRLIQMGDISGAAALLNRPHEMTGTIMGHPDQARSTFDIALPIGMCAPATDDYAGAVRRKDVALPWVPAILQVREDKRANQRFVRLQTGPGLNAVSGDLMAIRFFDKACNLSHGRLAAFA